jgi:hypothetical protein
MAIALTERGFEYIATDLDSCPLLGPDFDGSADRNQLPKFIRFFVRERNAPISPVMQSVRFPHPRILLGKTAA